MNNQEQALQNLYSEKKEQFHIEIRRKKREQIFSAKRIIVQQNLSLEILSKKAEQSNQQQNWNECCQYLLQMLDTIRVRGRLDEKIFSESVFQTLQNIIEQISSQLQIKIFTTILELYLTQQMPEIINLKVVRQVRFFQDYRQLALLLEMIQNAVSEQNLQTLIEKQELASQLIELYNFNIPKDLQYYYFDIIKKISKYSSRPYYYLKHLLQIIYKEIYNTINRPAIISLIVCVSDAFAEEHAEQLQSTEFVASLPNICDLLIEELQENNSKVLLTVGRMALVIIFIIKYCDEQIKYLLKSFFKDRLKQYINKSISNLYCGQYRLCISVFNQKIDDSEILHTVVNSEIFNTIMQLDQQELKLKDIENISYLLLASSRGDPNLINHIIFHTDFLFMIKILLLQKTSQDITKRALQTLTVYTQQLNPQATQIFIEKIKYHQIDILIEFLSDQYELTYLLEYFQCD